MGQVLSSNATPALVAGGVSLRVDSPVPDALQGLPDQPCLSNGMFGPPFAYSRKGRFLAFAVRVALPRERETG